MGGILEAPIADVEIFLTNSVQRKDFKLRSIRPNFPIVLERIDHFDLPLYILFNSCFGRAGYDLGDIVCEDDVPRRPRMWFGYVMDIDVI